MQHDVFANPQRGARSIYRFVVALQSDLSIADRCIVAPLVPRSLAGQAAAYPTTPIVSHGGEEYLVMLTLIGTLPVNALRDPLGSIAAWRDEITRGLDWLLWGV